MQKSQALAVSAIIASLLAATSVMALLTSQKTLAGTGSIKSVGLGVYWDQQATNATSSLNFGQLEPGSSKSFNLYLKNLGNSALTLTMTTNTWNPASAPTYLTLTWNREGSSINPAQVLAFTITLAVSANVQGIDSFSMNIIISGTG